MSDRLDKWAVSLVDENEKLRRENEALKADVGDLLEAATNEALYANQLRDDNERLRTAIQTCASRMEDAEARCAREGMNYICLRNDAVLGPIKYLRAALHASADKPPVCADADNEGGMHGHVTASEDKEEV